jgi:hypothetical protein
MKRILLAMAAAALALPAAAADLPRKAVPAAAPTPPIVCGLTGCYGWHADFAVLNSGSGINALDLGSISANGTSLGIGGGWQWFNGTYWLGASVMGAYDVTGAGNVGNIGNLSGSQVVELGGNIFGAFGLQPPQVNGFLSTITTAVLTADIGVCEHGRATGYCTGATAHYFMPSTPIELKIFYRNANYGTTFVANGENLTTEQIFGFGAAYHF